MNFKAIRGILLTLIGLSLLLFPAAALATPTLGETIYVKTTGEVKATFLGFSASYSNDLFLEDSALGIIFNNQSTPVGTEISLGTFTAGTVLEFRMHVNNTGIDYFTGPASLNPDGIEHAVVDGAYALNAIYVGFEDIFGGGDRDFNDLEFSLTNTTTSLLPPGAPLPGTILMVSTGIGLMALLRRKRNHLV